MNINYQ